MTMSAPMNDDADPSNPSVDGQSEEGAGISADTAVRRVRTDGLGTTLAAIGREVGGVELDIERHRDRLPSARAAQLEMLCAEDAVLPARDDVPANEKGGP